MCFLIFSFFGFFLLHALQWIGGHSMAFGRASGRKCGEREFRVSKGDNRLSGGIRFCSARFVVLAMKHLENSPSQRDVKEYVVL